MQNIIILTIGDYSIEYNYINYVKMEGFCWTIKLPEPTHYGQTFDLKPEQKAKASFKA